MKGYPHWLNTKDDYYYVSEHFPREQWLPDWQALLTDLMQWLFIKNLDTPEEGITDATHRVDSYPDDDGTMHYEQWEYKEDPNARLLQLGFTVEEVRDKLNEA